MLLTRTARRGQHLGGFRVPVLQNRPPIGPGSRWDQNLETDPALATRAPQESPKKRKSPEALNLEGAQQRARAPNS